MKWKETIKISMTQSSEDSNETIKMDLTSNVKITEMKNDKASKIQFSDFKGTIKSESTYGGEEPSREETDELKSKTMKFELTEEYQLKSDGKVDYKIREIFMFYPAGNILGFIPAKKAVKVGDSWNSDSLVPLNIKLIESEEVENIVFSNMESKFKFVKVETTKKIEIASISWSGKCDLAPEDEIEDLLSITWERTIKFDLTNRRVISTDGTISLSMEDSDLGEYSISRILEYDKSASTKKEEPKIEPKNDDEDE